jgi:hypothetical protein
MVGAPHGCACLCFSMEVNSGWGRAHAARHAILRVLQHL